MKLTEKLTMILGNLLVFYTMYAVYDIPEVKIYIIYFYMIVLTISISIMLLNPFNVMEDYFYNNKEKLRSTFYRYVSPVLDIIFLILCFILNYQIIFILYILNMLYRAYLEYEYFKNKEL